MDNISKDSKWLFANSLERKDKLASENKGNRSINGAQTASGASA